MEHTYSPQEFGKLIGRTTNTLQNWDRKGILKAHRFSRLDCTVCAPIGTCSKTRHCKRN